jgi:hypothetical protein
MRPKLWWIKERHNPQLGVYYSAMGQLSKAAAKRYEKPLYGDDYMLGFDSEEAYNAKLAELRLHSRVV